MYTVNLHFLRCCNYCCKFCFHRGMLDEKTLSINQWMRIIDNIAASGVVKRVNLAGGEPFMLPKYVIEILKYAKSKGIETSVISNGVNISESIFSKIDEWVDMLGISCDSGSDEINLLIGRHKRETEETDKPHCYHVRKVAKMCKEKGKYFKINTVICRENVNDDSIFKLINEIQPNRWKVFRVLKIDNENGVEKDERPPYEGYITDEELIAWQGKCEKYCNIKPVYENNDDMLDSYIQIDEEGYLLDSSSGSKLRSFNMLTDDFGESLNKIGFNKQKFINRGGFFNFNQRSTDIEDI